ncbi:MULTISPECIES: hypothetical protein [Flammeovirga]|uniref:Uncharacterized protein n=1 Tax=Flammeovirga agarivorans TaxID=2726742 RepID=A0A7X8SQA1_9BACT|nr:MULTISPECIES: hypothetical protein [Flammeovirga]NLR94341.1 hypothetical protein [Flammeovirga agarivorans]
MQEPTKEQEEVAIKKIISMINANGGPNIGHYLSHYLELDYHYKTSEGKGQLSRVGVYEYTFESKVPDEENIQLIREKFEFTDED